MKTKFFNVTLKRGGVIFAVLCAAVISSCSLSVSDADDVSTSSPTDAYLRIGGGSVGRSVLPDTPQIADMTGFVLTGTKSGASAKTLGTYGTYSALSAASIAIETGTWDFALRANKGAAVYRGTVSGKQIVQGENTIAFTLTLSDGSDGKGTVSLVFNLSDDASEKVSAASGSVYAVETNVQVSVTDSVKITANADGTKKITYTAQNIKAGTYLLKVAFYADEREANLINTWTEIAVVIADAASSAVREIASLNDVYAITYELNGGALAQGTVLQTCYTMFSAFSLPVPSRAGYIFEGWYTNESFAGAPVSAVAKGTTGDLALYARWTGSAITADVQGESDIAVEQVLDAGTVTFTAESGYDNYTWTVNGTTCGTENVFVFDTNALDAAVYEVLLVAKQGEAYRSFFALVTVSDVASAPYTVRHWLENADDDGYTLLASDTVTLYGKPATKTVATANDYDGFTAQGFEQKFISRNGTTTVDIYYNAKRVTYTLHVGAENSIYVAKGNGDYDIYKDSYTITGKVGAAFRYKSFDVDSDNPNEDAYSLYIEREGYGFYKWEPSIPVTFGESDMSFTAIWDFFANKSFCLDTITTTIGSIENIFIAPRWDSNTSTRGADRSSNTRLYMNYNSADNIHSYYWETRYANGSGKTPVITERGAYVHDDNAEILTLISSDNVITDYQYVTEDINGRGQWFTVYLTHTGTVSYTDENGNTISGYGTKVYKFSPEAAVIDAYSAGDTSRYSISYVMNGGTNPSVNTASAWQNSKPFIFADPTRTGYIFGGWYTTADFSGEPITQIDAGHTGNITVYAKWE